jgi:hypothetical protein
MHIAVLCLLAAQSVWGAPTPAPHLDARADFASRAFFDGVFLGMCPEHPAPPANFRGLDKSHPIVKRFIHVPKTGGTSMNAVLQAAAKMDGKLLCILTAAHANQQARFFARDQPFCDVLTSEFDGSHRFQVPESLTGRIMDFTLLRDPVRRAFSQYQHHAASRRYVDDEFDGKYGSDLAKENAERLAAFLSDTLCGLTEQGLTYCNSLKDPSKCSGRGWCGIFRNRKFVCERERERERA